MILPLDGLFSSADATHDARFQRQLTLIDLGQLLAGKGTSPDCAV